MPVQRITSASDPRLADYRDLTDVALRSAQEPVEGLYMAEGHLVMERALAAGHRPRSVLVEPKWLPQLEALLARVPDVDIFVGPAEVLRSVTGYRVHRGALAAMARPQPRTVGDVTAAARRILILEDLVDHTNVGAAFRNAAALGFEAVVVSPRCADPLYRRSVKVSMGAVLAMPWARATSWPMTLEHLRRDGFTLIALTPAGAAVAIADVAADPPARLAVLIGTEGSGLTPQARAAADLSVRIPMHGGIDSLNAAGATAVACYALGPVGATPGPVGDRTDPDASTG